MAEISLVTEPRPDTGTRASRRLRSVGRIPGVIYGHGVTPLAVSVEARTLRSALSTEAGLNAVFNLGIEGKRHLAIARELQRHPVRQTISHVDFQVVSRDELVPADVPLFLVGEAVELERAGGTIEHLVTQVPVKAKPGEIPTSFEIDIATMMPGDTVALSALVVPEGVSIEIDLETLVAVAHVRRVEVEEVEAAETTGEPTAAGDESPEKASDS